jgi:hypothetical protein
VAIPFVLNWAAGLAQLASLALEAAAGAVDPLGEEHGACSEGRHNRKKDKHFTVLGWIKSGLDKVGVG